MTAEHERRRALWMRGPLRALTACPSGLTAARGPWGSVGSDAVVSSLLIEGSSP